MNAKAYLFLCLSLLAAKIVVILLLSSLDHNFFGGGNDSDYYHAYALGQDNVAVNAWPIVLRWLNDAGLYSRAGVSHFLKFIGFIAIPFLVARLTYVRGSPSRNRVYWAAIFVVSAYPTLTFYTTDIYRDVFMVFLWVLGLFVFRALSSNPGFLKGLFLLFIGMTMTYVLYEFRPYLGFGYFIAMVFSVFYSFRAYPFWLSLIALVAMLLALYAVGLLEPILSYRELFSEGLTGGSNMGITFSSVPQFIPDLALTLAFQLFGIFIVNLSSVFVFFVESLPFTVFFYYCIKNRRFSTKFVDYLVVFFVVYSIIWLLGNDNLGTAVRLRMFSYISIFVAFCVIYQNKKMFLIKKCM